MKTLRDELVTYKKQTISMLDDLNDDKYIEVVTKRTSKGLTKRLQQLSKDVSKAVEHFNVVYMRYECRYDKIRYTEDVKIADTSFYQMWQEVEQLKKKCLSR